MAWFLTFVVGVVTAILGGVLSFLGGDMASRAHNMSEFEGKRGYFLVFLMIPAGLLFGFIVGFWCMRASGASTFGAAAKQQLLAALITVVVVAAVFGFSIWKAPRAPLQDGKYLYVDFELRVPADRARPDSLEQEGFWICLSGKGKDTRHAEFELAQSRTEGDHLVIPGTAIIVTTYAYRSLLVGTSSNTALMFRLPFAPKPEREDFEWTGWLQPTWRGEKGKPLEQDPWEARARVRLDTE